MQTLVFKSLRSEWLLGAICLMGASASLVVGEDVPGGAAEELDLLTVGARDPGGGALKLSPEPRLAWFTLRTIDPDVFVVVCDRHNLAGSHPSFPTAVDRCQIILRIILPVQDWNPLAPDQDLIVHREAVKVVAWPEEAVGAK